MCPEILRSSRLLYKPSIQLDSNTFSGYFILLDGPSESSYAHSESNQRPKSPSLFLANIRRTKTLKPCPTNIPRGGT